MSCAMGISRRRCMPMLLLLFAFALITGCDEESTQPVDNDWPELRPLTSPENVIWNLQIVYNDKTHSAAERQAAYASLLDPSFIFRFQEADIGIGLPPCTIGLPPCWELEAELLAHKNIFDAQADGDIYIMELRLTHGPAEDLTPPEVGHEGWKRVFATNVYLRLMTNLDDGIEVNGGQADFKFPPAEDGLFRIGEWVDLPRPGLLRDGAVEQATWGAIKAGYR